jgi:hypothetical protein
VLRRTANVPSKITCAGAIEESYENSHPWKVGFIHIAKSRKTPCKICTISVYFTYIQTYLNLMVSE